ncbi:MAG TPA: hypothetical protein VFB03_03105 [Candidatus Saccharimonadales bacterium]|nr:hypothetical protein [Candidatus Saccharimonadales bacterium]
MSEQTWHIGRMEVASPWGNAGGVVKTVEDVEAMARTGVGWVEAGSYTLEKRYGNKKDPITGELIIDPETDEPLVDYCHDPVSGETGNSLGMPNLGRDEVVRQIPEMNRIAASHGKEVVYNVAPVSDDPVSETLELVHSFAAAGARRIILNGACPNVILEGQVRHELLTRNPKMTNLVLRGLRPPVEKYPGLDIYLRIAPMDSYDMAKTVLRGVESAGTVGGIWAPNTWGGYKPIKDGKPVLTIEGNTGGKSGPAVADQVAKQVEWAVRILNGSKIGVVASSGVANWEAKRIRAAETLKRFMDIGAVAGAGTTFYYEIEDGWHEDTHRLLREFEEIA